MEEQDLAALRFQAAARDLERIVRNIAARYIVQGVPLSWRLLHAIEAEALADLGFASRHDAFVANLFRRPADMSYPETDDAATFGQSNALPAAFAFAVSAYEEATKKRSGQSNRVSRPIGHPNYFPKPLKIEIFYDSDFLSTRK